MPDGEADVPSREGRLRLHSSPFALSGARRLRRQFAPTFRRAATEVAANLRAPVVERAEEAARVALHAQCGAPAVAHAHVRAVPDEVRRAFRLLAEPFPVVAGHADVGVEARVAAHAAAKAVGRHGVVG